MEMSFSVHDDIAEIIISCYYVLSCSSVYETGELDSGSQKNPIIDDWWLLKTHGNLCENQIMCLSNINFVLCLWFYVISFLSVGCVQKHEFV